MKKQWTLEETETVLRAFLAGKRIKVIARETGRTDHSVSKLINRARSNDRQNMHELYASSVRGGLSQTTASSRLSLPKTVSLNSLITYLRRQGFVVQRLYDGPNLVPEMQPKTQEGRFQINGEPVSVAQMLIRANKIRLDQGVAVFILAQDIQGE